MNTRDDGDGENADACATPLIGIGCGDDGCATDDDDGIGDAMPLVVGTGATPVERDTSVIMCDEVSGMVVMLVLLVCVVFDANSNCDGFCGHV